MRSTTRPVGPGTSPARGALRRIAVSALIALLLAPGLAALRPTLALAAGSGNLFPTGLPGNRANLEWRTSSYGGGLLLRRTLFHVFMNAGEVLDVGSTAVGQGTADITVYNPGVISGPVGTETIGAASFSCNTQRGGGPANQGKILSRANETTGPDTIPASIAGAYVPCNYTAPSTGVYGLVFSGPAGFSSDNNGTIAADIALTNANDFNGNQGSTVAAWDATVRSSVASATNIPGRVFTYYLALNTGGNGLPVNSSNYAVTTDGYQYKIDYRGMDPNGWIEYGNQVGFLDSNGTSPLYHDAVAANAGAPQQLTNIQGGVTFAVPSFPLFFEAPAAATVAALGIPATPATPLISAVSFSGNVSGNTSTFNSGGTFNYTANISAVYQIVISLDGINFDPTLTTNRVLRGVNAAGTVTAVWDGKDNAGNPFPVGSYTSKAAIHAGEYHFPFIDVENDVPGGPTITLLNAPCPGWTGGCKGAFYDDRAYRTLNGTIVDGGNTVGSTLCGVNPPATNAADPLLGFDTSSTQRGFGAASGGNTNVPCTGNFGDTKGLDIWTYTPSSTATTPVQVIPAQADIAVTQTATTVTPGVGTNDTFTITVTNNGQSPATGLQVTDVLPAGLTFVSATPSGATTYTAGTGVWNIGNLAVGATATLQLVATVGNANPITNTASKTAETEIDPVASNNSASFTINPRADIAITQSASSTTPNQNSTVTLTVTATNNGPSSASGVQVTDLLPAGLSLVTATPSQGSYVPGTGVWTIGTIANLAAPTLTLVATVTGTAAVTNTATKTAETEPDPVAGNNSASQTITGQAADIQVTQGVSSATPNYGTTVTFTVTAKDNGPNNATGVTVGDLLPAGLTFVSATPSGVTTYNSATGLWTIGNLNNGVSATLQIVAAVNSCTPVSNVATRSASNPVDVNAANDSATSTVTPQAADIAVSMAVSNPNPNLGSQTTFTITATNNGPNAGTGVTVTDLLPAGLAFFSATPSGATTYNSGTGLWTIGNLANGASATLTLVATAASTSGVTNTASRSGGAPPDCNAANNSASQTVTGQQADIQVTQAVSNATPLYGSNTTFTVTVTNLGPSTATGVNVTDLLPVGLSLVTATPSGATTYVPGTGLWTIGSLASAASATLQLLVTDNSAGTLTNTATKSAENQPDPVSANDSASQSATGQAADIGVSMAVSTATPNLGANTVFTVTVINNGPIAATGVQVTDLLPAGLAFVSGNPSQGTYTSGSGLWNIGNLAVGASVTLLLTATDNSTSALINTASRSAGSPPDHVPANNSASQTVTGQQADIAITNTVSNANPSVNSNVTFTVTATNAGPSNATGVQVTDLLPAGFTFVSATPSAGSYTPGSGLWNIGAIAAGAAPTLLLVATVTAAGAHTDTATKFAEDQPDPNAANDTATASINGQAADIGVAMTASTNFPALNGTVTFTVTATNNGPNNATGVQVTDLLPAGLTFVSATPSGATTYASGTGVWNIGNLANGAAATLTLTATNTQTGGVTNTATRIASAPADLNSANDSASQALAGQADIQVTQTVSNATPDLGTNTTFTVTVTNAGPVTATGVAVTDLLPAGLALVTATPSGATTYNAGTGAWTVGTLANGATATLTLLVTDNSTSALTNTAAKSAENEGDPVAANNSAARTVTGQAADIQVTQTVSNATPNLGGNVTFTVTATNGGPNAATGVSVTDLLPAGLALVTATPSGVTTYNSGTGLWTIGSLANGASATLTIVATDNSTGPLTNTASRSAGSPVDPVAGNNSASQSVTGQAADIAISQTVSNSAPNLGSNTTFTVTATNGGPNAGTGVQVTDLLPAGLTLVTATPSVGTTYTAGTGLWNIGNLANGASATLQLLVTDNSTATNTNTATRTASAPVDPNSANDAASQSATGQQADIQVVQTVSTATPDQNSNVTLTVTVTDLGPSAASGVTVKDLLPAGMTFVSATPSAAYNSATGIWTVPTLANGASTTLQVVATVTDTAAHTLTASKQTETQPDPSAANDASSVTVTGQAADLQVTQVVDNATPGIGTNVTFTMTTTNLGPNSASGVVVKDLLPAGLTFVSALPSGATLYDSTTGNWTIGGLGSGAAVTLQVVATVTTTAPQTNTAARTASTPVDPVSGNNSASVLVSAQQADIGVSMAVSTSTPNLGANVTFTVTALNNGPNGATGVNVSDLLPGGLAFVSATPSGTSTYNSGTGVWAIGNLGNGAAVTLQLVATVNSTSARTNTATRSSSNPADGNPANDAASQSVTGQAADIAVSMTVSNSAPNLGSNTTFTVTATNNGPNAATGVQVTDLVPAGLTLVSATPSVATTYTPGSGLWSIGSLALNASATLQLLVTDNSTATVTNTASRAAGAPVDPNAANDSASQGVTGQQADIQVAMGVGNATPDLGTNTTFSITVTNAGPSAATNVAVTDLLPSGLTFVSATPSAGSYNSTTGVWTIGPMVAAGAVSMSLVATATSTSPVTNTAAKSAADQPDPNAANNSASQTVTGQAADIALTQAVSNATPNLGSNTTFTITATNNGPNAATGVQVTDLVPAGLAIVSTSPSGATTYNSGSGLWNVGSLAVGASASLAITVTDNSTSTLTNTAGRTASSPVDPNAGNDSASASATGQQADIRVTQAVSNPTPDLASNVTFTITATNLGPSSATGVIVNDLLPAGLALVSATPSGATTYASATGVWTVGTLANAGVATLTIVATDNSTSPLTNTAAKAAEFQPDPNAANDSAAVTVTGQAADIQVTMAVSNPSPNLGANTVFTVTATNLGPNAATAVQVTDLLPAGLTYFASSPSGTTTYDSTSGLWNIGNLANGAFATIQITVTDNSVGAVTNTASRSAGNPVDPNAANNSASSTVTGQAADIQVAQSVSTTTPNLGSTVAFTVTATNLGPNNATAVQVVDKLPVGLSFVSSTQVGTYNSGSGVWVPGAIANGASATLQLVATVTSTVPLTNTANRSGGTPTDPNAANDSASATVTGQAANVAVSKTVDNPTPNVGSNVTFTVTATNNGPSTATGVAVTDSLPSGLTFVSATPSLAYNSTSGVWTVGSLVNGASATLQVVATVTTSSPITNIATRTGLDQPDPGPGSPTAGATVTGQSADIAVTKTVDNANPNVGDTATFTVTAHNNGPSAATGVVITDKLPAGLTFVSANPNGAYNATTGTWTVGSLANGSDAILQVVARVTGSSPVTNLATKTAADQPDPNSGNDSASATVAGQAADIAITKTVSNPTASVGDTVTFTVTATNNGPSAASAVVVTDLLPAGLTFVSSTPSGSTTYVPATGRWTVGSLANGASATLQVVATVNSPTGATNTATRTAQDQPDPNPANDSASAAVAPVADIRVLQTVDNPAPYRGEAATFTITVTNLGPSTGTGVVISDLLPAGLALLQATASATTSYDSATGAWTIGSMALGASATLTLKARVDAANPITNTASKSAENEHDPDLANDSAARTVSAVPSADIVVTQVVDTALPNLGGPDAFTVTVTNNGPSDATGVRVVDLLPPDLALTSAPTSAGTAYDATSGLWTIGALPLGASVTLRLNFIDNTLQARVNTATKTAEDQHDPNLSNDSSTATATGQQADVEVKITVSDPTPYIDTDVTFTITATNLGPTGATGLSLRVLIPAGTAFVSSSGTPPFVLGAKAARATVPTYDPSTGTWVIGSLPVGWTTILKIRVTIHTLKVVVMSVHKLTEDQPDPNSGNDVASAAVASTAVPGLPQTGTGRGAQSPSGLPLALLEVLTLLSLLLALAIVWRRRRSD